MEARSLLTAYFPGVPLVEGSAIEEAVRDFQRQRHLPETGRVDGETLDELRRAVSWIRHEAAGREDGPPEASAPSPAASPPRSRELALGALALQTELIRSTQPRLACGSLVESVRVVSDEKWDGIVREASDRATEASLEVMNGGPSAYRRMPVEQRHEMWVGILLSGNTRAGHRILESLRGQHLPGSEDLHAQALRELRYAAQQLAAQGVMVERIPDEARLEQIVNDVIVGPPRTAAEVEAAAVLAGDPPPPEPHPAAMRLAGQALLVGIQVVERFQLRHGARPGESAIGAMGEEMLPSVSGEVRGEILERVGGAALSAVIDALTVLGAGMDTYRRATDRDYAMQRAISDELWRIATEEPPPGTEHLPAGRRVELLRAAMLDALTKFEARQEWLARHPEHPHSPGHREER